MGLQLEFLNLKMKILLAVVVLTIVGAHAASDIVVKVDEEELSPLLRTFCCGSVQQRCARACTGRSCSLRCQGYCGVFNSRCGPYTCSSVTNACQSTTTTTTTAAATTAADTTTGGATTTDSANTTGGETTTGGATTTGGNTTTGGATTTAAGTTSGDATTTGGATTAGDATTTDAATTTAA